MRYPLIYGTISGAIAIGVLVASIALKISSHAESLWFGYLVMLLALTLIFVGVKRYRDVECGGAVGFGRAFGVGLGIAVVAGLIYVAGWETYVAVSGADYMADYTAKTLADLRASGASEAVLAAKAQEMAEMTKMYDNPLLRLPMVFAEIFPVGLLVSLVSAAVLRNPRVLPAA
jgi:uncharacterized protein DUF4199